MMITQNAHCIDERSNQDKPITSSIGFEIKNLSTEPVRFHLLSINV